jgi:hypothetical protein
MSIPDNDDGDKTQRQKIIEALGPKGIIGIIEGDPSEGGLGCFAPGHQDEEYGPEPQINQYPADPHQKSKDYRYVFRPGEGGRQTSVSYNVWSGVATRWDREPPHICLEAFMVELNPERYPDKLAARQEMLRRTEGALPPPDLPQTGHVRSPARRRKPVVVDWRPVAQSYASSSLCQEVHAWLSEELGVSQEALRAMGVGARQRRVCVDGDWQDDEVVATIPMFDGAGKYTGILWRAKHRDGEEKVHRQFLPRSDPGLFYNDRAFRYGPLFGTLYICEGFSDVAALRDLCIWQAVGRSSAYHVRDNLGQLVQLLLPHPELNVIVLADRDSNHGGERRSQELAAALRGRIPNLVRVCMAPGGSKDSRAWIVKRLQEGTDWEMLRREYRRKVSTGPARSLRSLAGYP